MNCNSGSTIYEEAVGREGSWARPCDGCCLAPSVVYCHADSAYLCASCDVRIHAANRVASRHERVCLSDAYKHAPAVLECRTDAAAYEAQVHYANLLAGMHQCVPVVSHTAGAIPAASSFDKAAATTTMLGCKEEEVSWLLLSENSANHNCSGNNSSSSTYFSEVDEYFDLAGYNSYYDSHMNNNQAQYVMQEQQHLEQMQMEYPEKEYVVPSQAATASKQQQQQQQSGDALVGAEQAVSVPAGVSAYADSFNNSISFSPMEAGIVPDNTVIDMPHSSVLTPAGGSSGISGPPLQMPLQFSSMDREARVLRYKEKKKTRTFQKTTRYATRKAYAEARPRIKGRFAKRLDTEIDLDQMFSTAVPCDTSYSTVPWF